MIQLVVVANNRPDTLKHTVAALAEHLPDLYTKGFVCNDTDQRGMAANIQTAWTRALDIPGWHYLAHWEDDMKLLRLPPLQQIVNTLYNNPQVANIILKRQPWNYIETATGCVHEAIRQSADTHIQHDLWGEHDYIFSLNPCLIPRRIVERGWPAGNEAEMTAKLKADGYTFGVWGHPHDEPWIEHIGYERGPGWRL